MYADLREMSTVVCYHYPCPDGIFGALCAHLALEKKNGDRVRWLPLTVYEKPESRLKHVDTIGAEDTVYLIDFSGGVQFIQALSKVAKKVILIDHHLTAQQDFDALKDTAEGLPRNFEYHIDMNFSGASLARQYFKLDEVMTEIFKGSADIPEAVNQLIEYIEDNDLWRHKLDQSKEFSSGFGSLKLELDANKNPEIFSTLTSLRVPDLLVRGREAIELQNRIISEDLTRAYKVSIPYTIVDAPDTTVHFNCLAVVTQHPEYRSDLGSRLAKASAEVPGLVAAGVVIYEEADMEDADKYYKVSIRTIGDVNGSIVSKAFGGGGHLNASSCVVLRSVVDGWKNNDNASAETQTNEANVVAEESPLKKARVEA